MSRSIFVGWLAGILLSLCTVAAGAAQVVAVDFGPQGLWTHGTSGWRQESTLDPTALESWGDQVAVAFGGGGTYAFDGTDWTYLTFLEPTHMVAWNDKLVLAFSGGGLWSYDASGWAQLSSWDPEHVAAWEDKLAVGFGAGRGLWYHDGTGWSSMTTWDPYALAPWGNALAAAFDGGRGLWRYTGGSWSQLTSAEPTPMKVWNGQLAAVFPGGGLWGHDGASWNNLTGWDPYDLEAWGTKLLASFDAGRGLWEYSGGGWAQLTTSAPVDTLAAESEIYAALGGAGLYRYAGTMWSALTSWSPEAMTALSPNFGGPSRPSVCVDGNCSFTSLQNAFSAAQDGSSITISGEWQEGATLNANNVTITGVNGAHLRGGTVQGKGAMVIAGSNTVIQNLECSEIAVPDRNGACVRSEKPGLTLTNVYFHDSEEGVLAGSSANGVIVVEDSTFERLGRDGQAHGIYVNAGELIIRRSQFLSSKDQGHEVKSRAFRTTIENSTIASLEGVDSRLIDIPNGGEVILRNNVFEQGPNSANSQAIGIGLEGVTHGVNSILLENNVIILERNGNNVLLSTSGVPAPTLLGNAIVGGMDPGGANSWYLNRAAAELPPYPYLPPVP